MYYSIAPRLLFRRNGSAGLAEHVREENGSPVRCIGRLTP